MTWLDTSNLYEDGVKNLYGRLVMAQYDFIEKELEELNGYIGKNSSTIDHVVLNQMGKIKTLIKRFDRLLGYLLSACNEYFRSEGIVYEHDYASEQRWLKSEG